MKNTTTCSNSRISEPTAPNSITVTDLLHSFHGYLVIDVRGPETFAASHISGSFNVFAANVFLKRWARRLSTVTPTTSNTPVRLEDLIHPEADRERFYALRDAHKLPVVFVDADGTNSFFPFPGNNFATNKETMVGPSTPSDALLSSSLQPGNHQSNIQLQLQPQRQQQASPPPQQAPLLPNTILSSCLLNQTSPVTPITPITPNSPFSTASPLPTSLIITLTLFNSMAKVHPTLKHLQGGYSAWLADPQTLPLTTGYNQIEGLNNTLGPAGHQNTNNPMEASACVDGPWPANIRFMQRLQTTEQTQGEQLHSAPGTNSSFRSARAPSLSLQVVRSFCSAGPHIGGGSGSASAALTSILNHPMGNNESTVKHAGYPLSSLANSSIMQQNQNQAQIRNPQTPTDAWLDLPPDNSNWAFPSCILPDWLFLGPDLAQQQSTAEALSSMETLGITAVLNMTYSPVPEHVKYPMYMQLPINDLVDAPITPLLFPATDFIENARIQGHKVYVHCHAGKSRSPTVVVAYLVRFKNMTLEAAMKHTVTCRPATEPNLGFLMALKEFSKSLSNPSLNSTLPRDC